MTDTAAVIETLVSRFRPSTVLGSRLVPDQPLGGCYGVLDVGGVRLIALDSRNPHGGVGGSIDSDQCAWLVRQLDLARDRYVVVAAHDSSFTMLNRDVLSTMPPRVLGPEIASILLAHETVLAWVNAQIPLLAEQRHGHSGHGFWELPAWSWAEPLTESATLEVWRAGSPGSTDIVIRRGRHDGHPAGSAQEWRLSDPLAEGAGGRTRPGERPAGAVALR